MAPELRNPQQADVGTKTRSAGRVLPRIPVLNQAGSGNVTLRDTFDEEALSVRFR